MPTNELATGPLPDQVHAHFFRSIYDVSGRAWRGPMTRLAQRLSEFPTRRGVSDKRLLPCWSPCAPWDDRVNAQVGALVLDFDEGSSVEEALDRCAAWALVLHTSWSHRAEAPRFRVVLPLSRPVPRAEWTARWELATAALGLTLDRHCKDPRRRYLLPAAPEAQAPRRSVIALNRPALDLVSLPLPPTPAPSWRSDRPELRVPARLQDSAVRMRLRLDPASRERAAVLLGAQPVGEGDRRRAQGIPCPACRRASVWFYVAPQRLRRACCNHRNSCGWAGGLEELLGWAP